LCPSFLYTIGIITRGLHYRMNGPLQAGDSDRLSCVQQEFSMGLPGDVTALIEATMEHVGNDRVLIIRPEGLADITTPAEAVVDTLQLADGFDPATALSFQRRYRLAVVIGAPDIIGRVATQQMLAHLRNVAAHGVLAVFARSPKTTHAPNPQWSVSDFLGLGFRRAAHARALTSDYWVYRYNIYDYKITPDWLNSRYWANPEQWGRERW
tara:strand:+ start:10534 stop:11163 length:630 start_codon:yes stop_codon:yes gene_type:complete